MSTQHTELDPQNFQNDQLTVTVTKLPQCLVKFEITVTPEATEAAYQKAMKNVAKEVSVPGFRKGKAPAQFIQDRFQSAIQKEWVDVLLQTGFNEALHLAQVHPLRDGLMKRPVVQECSRENGARFTLEFETRPQIPSINPADLQIKKIEARPVTSEQEEQALRQVRSQFITYEPVTDRGIQNGDFVDLDLDILEPNPRRVTSDTRVEVNEAGIPAWIRSKIMGLKGGETAEGQTEQDPNNPQENFQPVTFRVTVHAIWKGEMPEANDELAKKVGLQSFDELKQKIQERLQREAEETALSRLQQELDEQLLAKYPVELPKTLVDQDKKARLEDYLNQMRKENQNEQAIRANLKQIESMIEASTIQSLSLFFLMRKFAAEHHIDVDDQDVAQELNKQLALLSSGHSSIDITGNKDDLREQVHTLALNRKIRQALLDQVKLES